MCGRPKSTHCKRGHPRVVGEKSCYACRLMRQRWKYELNKEFRERKRAYARQYRREFFAKNGFWSSSLYDRKPKEMAA